MPIRPCATVLRRATTWARRGHGLRLALALVASLWLGPAAAQAPARPASITVVLDNNYPPFVFLDSAGETQGILKDRWALWSQRTGIRVDLQPMDWAKAQQTILAGQADVIDTIFETEARKPLYDFSRPYATIDVPIFFHETISGIVNADSLKGFTVGVKAGDACIDVLRRQGVESMKSYPGYSEVIAAASAGEVRVFCVDQPPALYLMNRLGVVDQFRRSLPLYTGAFHRAVRKGDVALLKIVEEGFARITEAEARAIDEKWYGAPVNGGQPWWRRHTREAAYALLATLLALSALAGWNLTLRRRVKARTVALTRSIDQANAARDQLEATLAAVPDLLFEIDADGRYIDCRANRADLLIAPPEQLIGRLIRDAMPAEAADVAMAAVQEAMRDGQSSGRQMRLPLPDGEHWFELSAARKGGTAAGDDRVIVLSRDITDRKRAELALRQSEHSFRQFFDAGLVGMAITVPGQQWSQCNARLAEMLGYEVDELARMTWVELTHPEDLPADMAQFERVMAGETDGYTMDKRFIRKDGSIVDAAIAVRCERDAQGQAVRFFAIVEDISARKRAEQALERHSEQLEAQVALRSRELVQARDQAQAASRAKSELLSRMSHELRTPMNAILGFSQLLEVDRSLPDTARRFVTEILRAGQHLLNLINDVLDLAHVESGRISLSPEALDLQDFLPEVLSLLQPLADRRGVRLSLLDGGGLVARVDRTRLKQVVVNLVSNAIKYNRNDGSVSVEVVATGDDTLRLWVRDTGPGIEPQRIAGLFEPFNRLGAEFGTVEGTGIGLSICHRLVELMGGRIGVDSQPGRGCAFWVELPRAVQPGTPKAPAAAEAPAPLPSSLEGTVLYVEDNPANLKLMEGVVGRHPNLRLLSALTAEIGIEMAREHRPDLIVMDINLPGMDGYAALDVLRADPLTRYIPAVALTANAMASDARRAVAAGFAEHVAKPIDLQHFDALLRRLLTTPA